MPQAAMRNIACRRMIQNEASFVRSGASFETCRLRRRSLRREEVVGSYNIGSLRDSSAPRMEFSHLRKIFAPLEGVPTMTSRHSAALRRGARPCAGRVAGPCRRPCIRSRQRPEGPRRRHLCGPRPPRLPNSRSVRGAGSSRCWKYAGKASKAAFPECRAVASPRLAAIKATYRCIDRAIASPGSGSAAITVAASVQASTSRPQPGQRMDQVAWPFAQSRPSRGRNAFPRRSTLIDVNVLQPCPASGAKTFARLIDAPQEARICSSRYSSQSSSDSKPMRMPAGFPWRVMTISWLSASRR